ncbi:MAG: hypothetical protein WAT66_03365 [Actinomycetota bacterium]
MLIGTFKRMRLDQLRRHTGRTLKGVRDCVTRLERDGWLEYVEVLCGDKDLWTIWPTGAGLEAVGLNASLYRGRPALANLPHDFSLVEISLAMLKEDPQGKFVPERLVRPTYGYGQELVKTEDGEFRRSHRPDGVFVRSDGTMVIVECETSTKDKKLREWMMAQNEGYVNPQGEEHRIPRDGEADGPTQEDGRVLPRSDGSDAVAYFSYSTAIRSRLQLTEEELDLHRVEIFPVPGEVYWPAGTRLNR